MPFITYGLGDDCIVLRSDGCRRPRDHLQVAAVAVAIGSATGGARC